METFKGTKDIKARLISVDEVVNLLLQKRAYSKEDDFCWKIYTEMIQNIKNIPENETPRQLKSDLDKAVELLSLLTQDPHHKRLKEEIKSFLTEQENKTK